MDVQAKKLLYALGEGDKICDRVEYYLFNEELEGLSKFSRSLVEAVNTLSSMAVATMNAKVVMAGGDDVLFLIAEDRYKKELLLELLEIFKSSTGSNFSFGVGNTITNAYLNVRKAKSLGGGRVVE